MDYVQNFECWYRNVCQESIHGCCGQSACIRYMEMKHLMDASGIPVARQYPAKLMPDDIDYKSFTVLASVKNTIQELINNGDFNLYICGNNTGNGKTSWAIKIMLKYFDTIWAGNGFRTRGLFVHVPTLLMQLKNFQNPLSEEYKKDILNADLVIFDDIAVSNISQYDYSNLLMFLDSRILNSKANIFTSNKISRKSLEDVVGSRLASRIWEVSTIVELKGKDRRNG